MNLAIAIKSFREILPLTLFTWFGVTISEMFFVLVAREMGAELFEFVSRLGFLRQLLEAMSGISMGEQLDSSALIMFGFTHPMMLAFGFGYVMAASSRISAVEVEQGTADLLFTLPLSRLTVLSSSLVAWTMSLVPIALGLPLGAWIGTQVFAFEGSLNFNQLLAATANYYLLCLAVGCITSLASCVSNRRGPAITIAVAVVLASLLLNIVQAYVPAIKSYRYLGLLAYYQPFETVRHDTWPWTDMAVLLTIAAVTWSVGAWVFSRKDIPAP